MQTPVSIPGLGAVVQSGTAAATTPAVVSANQTSTTANKILLPSAAQVKVSSSEGKQIITSPTKVVTVTSKDGTGTQQFVLTNALKQQSEYLFYKSITKWWQVKISYL